MAYFSLCVIFVLLTIFLEMSHTAKECDPYKVILERVGNCNDKGTGEMSVESTAKKGNDGEMYHSGVLKMPYGLGDKNFKAFGEASIQDQNGEYKPIGLISEIKFDKACSNIMQTAPVFFDIIKAAGIQSPQCPIAKGDYQMKKYHVGPTLGIKRLKCGKYRVRVHFVRNGQKIGCFVYFAQIVAGRS